MKQKCKELLTNKALLLAAAVLAITSVMLLNYIAYSLAGHVEWAIMSSSYFGVPEELQDTLGEPLCTNGSVGWDGQFYYYISNDILGVKDTSQHVDAPPYRWQRVGLPLVVKCVSLLLGQQYVTVGVFLSVNILIVTAASYVFARFLHRNGRSVLWVLPWVFSVGVQLTLRHALPDGAADAFLLMAVICLLEKKYIRYSVLISLAVLSREAGILIAFLFFLMAFFGILDKEKRFNVKFAFPFAVPGGIFILWYGYVTWHFGLAPYKATVGITQFFLMGAVDYFLIALQSGSWIEIIGILIYVTTILGSLGLFFMLGRKNKPYLAFIPYTLLFGCFGPVVMMHFSGYLKGISSLFAIVPIVLTDYFSKNEGVGQLNKRWRFGYKLVVLFFAGVLVTGVFYTEYPWRDLYATHNSVPMDVTDDTTVPLTEFKSEIKLLKNKGAVWANIPYKSFFMRNHRYTLLNVEVTNTSTQTWKRLFNADGIGAVSISYQWYRLGAMDEVYLEGVRTQLPKNVEPGETVNTDMYVDVPDEPGEYVLRVSLVQDGVAWFHLVSGGYLDIYYVVN